LAVALPLEAGSAFGCAIGNGLRQAPGGNKHRKVQFVIAGKAHPKDIPGKELIRDINHFIREQNWKNR